MVYKDRNTLSVWLRPDGRCMIPTPLRCTVMMMIMDDGDGYGVLYVCAAQTRRLMGSDIKCVYVLPMAWRAS